MGLSDNKNSLRAQYIAPEFHFSPLRSLRCCGIKLFFGLAIFHILIACTPGLSPTPTNSPITCLGFIILNAAPHRCEVNENRALISNEAEQITLEAYGTSIVIQGQVELITNETSFSLHLIQGRAVLGLRGRTYILSNSNSLEIPLIDGTAQAPIEIAPASNNATLLQAESTIESLSVAEPTPTLEGDCLAREDWGQTYTVQSGDVLSEIAEAYNLSIEEIAQANCLADPSRLRIGQVLRIAGDTPTATPSAIAFRADNYTLQVGECTTLRWDVFNVAEVYLDDSETSLNSFLEVCPEATITYNLRVVFLDGSETQQELIITVEQE